MCACGWSGRGRKKHASASLYEDELTACTFLYPRLRIFRVPVYSPACKLQQQQYTYAADNSKNMLLCVRTLLLDADALSTLVAIFLSLTASLGLPLD